MCVPRVICPYMLQARSFDKNKISLAGPAASGNTVLFDEFPWKAGSSRLHHRQYLTLHIVIAGIVQ